MKTMTLIVVILTLLAGPALAQETLFDGKVDMGGFGGPAVLYTTFNGEDGLLVGGQGAFLIHHRLYLGGGGYGLATRHQAPGEYINETWQELNYEIGYGGGLIGTVIRHNDLVHATADVMIAGGCVTRSIDNGESDGDGGQIDYPHDAFFALQPMGHLELNVTDWMRLDAGAGYRFVTGITKFNLENEDLRGVVAGLTLRFGSF